MTDDAFREIAALRDRLAQLEGLLERPKEETTMYPDHDEPAEERRVRQLGELWQHDPAMENLITRLEREPDLAIAPNLRMTVGYYREGRAAAKAIGKRIDGREGPRLDTTGDRS